MSQPLNCPDDFRIEISGWGLDNSFFAEKTDLLWTSDGKKRVQLHRALPEGAIVFIRLLTLEPSSGSVPMTYRVQDVLPMDCDGRCQMTLEQLRPCSKESLNEKNASNGLDESRKESNVRELKGNVQHEEVLQ